MKKSKTKNKQCKLCPMPRSEGKGLCKDLKGNLICLRVKKESENEPK